MSLKPIEKQSLAETVQERLLAFVQSGEVRPGAALPSQHELARRLNVSRPILREAMQGLAALGVIEIRAGSGCYVLDPRPATDFESWFDSFSHEGAIQVLEARKVVEVELAGFAAVRATDEDFAVMDAILDRLKRSVARGRPTAQITSDFHQALSRAGRNEPLFRMAQLLTRARLLQGLRVERALPEIAAREFESHLRLREAVASRDPGVAKSALREHLDLAHGWEEEVNSLRKQISSGQGSRVSCETR